MPIAVPIHMPYRQKGYRVHRPRLHWLPLYIGIRANAPPSNMLSRNLMHVPLSAQLPAAGTGWKWLLCRLQARLRLQGQALLLVVTSTRPRLFGP